MSLDYNVENAIEINNLNKSYKGFDLKDVTFNVPSGQVTGFIGQNGAGKSTTIRAILNMLRRDSGDIKVFGADNIAEESNIKENVGVVFDDIGFHPNFKAKHIDKILKGMYKKWDSKAFYEYLDKLGLPTNKKVGQYSRGMQMKLQIATALSHHAKLLIMDEATTGLDPVVRNECLDIFLEYLQDENHTILMSSHITSDLEKVADSVTFINKGKLLLTGYKDDVLYSHGVIKCKKSDFRDISPADYISARLTDFGAEIMVDDKEACKKKYSGVEIDSTTLEEIMLFYVNSDKKEWS